MEVLKGCAVRDLVEMELNPSLSEPYRMVLELHSLSAAEVLYSPLLANGKEDHRYEKSFSSEGRPTRTRPTCCSSRSQGEPWCM